LTGFREEWYLITKRCLVKEGGMVRPKENDREDIRALVLEKAKKLFLELGYHKLTIRKLADEIGYTAGTIYLYFRNKDEILYELHNEGFKLLFQYKMRMMEQGVSSGLDRLRQGGQLYIDFALENPDYYELMFNMPEPRNFMEAQKERFSGEGQVPEDYAMRSYEFLKQGIQEYKKEGYLKEVDEDTATFTLWSLVHGLVSLIIRKRIPYPQAPSKELAREALDFFGRLLVADRFATDTRERLNLLEHVESD
jgi:AcrR family transcriptional regulator